MNVRNNKILLWINTLSFTLYALRFLSVPIYAIQIFKCSLQTTDKTFFPFAEPYARIIKFLVRFFRAFRITQLGLQVWLILFIILLNTFPECPLQIGIEIHFDCTISNSFTNLILGRSAAAMKNKINRLRFCFQFFLYVILTVF